MKHRQLIVVSNRLPIRLCVEGEQSVLKPSGGGLVAAVQPVVKQIGASWIGFLGFQVTPEILQELKKAGYETLNLNQAAYERYYNGYCNGTLWPIMHCFIQTATFLPSDWDAYLTINQQFARVIANKAPLHAKIWVHDYHLMILPSLLKRLRPDLFISYFHHIPFPALDIFSLIPQAETIIDSLLQCDHIGFHTENYLNNFKYAAKTMISAKINKNRINHKNHSTLISANPISIDYEEFNQLSLSENCEQSLECLKSRNLKIILGVDRLDYTKGILERLEGFRQFLSDHPEWIGRVILLQLCVPSREDVPSYIKLKNKIERLVGEINGEFGSFDYTPIHYFYQSLDRSQLVGLYKSADMMLVTSLRDGMNLVSKEYIASNSHEQGVLVLSKFAGSALELKGSILVNPYCIREISGAIYQALTMPTSQKRKRMTALRQIVKKADQASWSHQIFADWSKSIQTPTKAKDLQNVS